MLKKLIAFFSVLGLSIASTSVFAKDCGGYGADVKDGNKIEKIEKEA